MTEFSNNFLAVCITLAYASLLLAFVIAFVRLAKGPTLADRVVALDLIAILVIGLIAIYTLDSGQKSFLDIAITLALVAFLSTIAFARFIAKRDDTGEE